MIPIAAFTPFTLLDDPGHLACTIFLAGCPARCPYCHNAAFCSSDYHSPEAPTLPEIFLYLEKRKNTLESVCISGGEALMHAYLSTLLQDIRSFGYRVKLDTNGFYPEHLQETIDNGLVDAVSMDIKNAPDACAETCGLPFLNISLIRKSIEVLQKSRVEHEFRTTVVKEFHSPERIQHFFEWGIQNSPLYLQRFVPSEMTPDSSLHACSPTEMNEICRELKKKIPFVYVRGCEIIEKRNMEYVSGRKERS